jgi:hypothetical protein
VTVRASKESASSEVREIAEKLYKPIWNTEEHVYLKGFGIDQSLLQTHPFADRAALLDAVAT